MDKAKLFERLRPLVANELWDRLEDYLEFTKEELTASLIASQDIRTINKLQGEILALQKILDLPSDMKRRTS